MRGDKLDGILIEVKPRSSDTAHDEFSLSVFAVTILGTLVALLATLRLVAPEFWSLQWRFSFGEGVFVFLAISLLTCFVEYFFHRYVLHSPAIPFLRRLYRQHTLHHALTRIARRPSRDGNGILFIENQFPIVEPEQTEASFFPWYSFAVFALILAPLFTLLQVLLPGYPWFLGGFLALASSLTLYELLHAINHWPFEKWEPLLMHPTWGRLWRPLYGFHLRHHAVIDCNESISGFFGLPVADWLFGTCIIPQTVYAAGEVATPEKFTSPRPIALIRWLDGVSERSVARRRAQAAASSRADGSAALPVATSVERAAAWATQGVGLLASVASITLLIVFASVRGEAWHVATFAVFGASLILFYGLTFVARLRRRGWSPEFSRRLRWALAFVVIAATYAPFLLTPWRGPSGWIVFGAFWGLCGAAALFQFLRGERRRIVATIGVVFVVWTLGVTIRPLLAHLSPGALWLLFGGIACYLLATGFAQWSRLRFQQSLQQLCVLGGSTCHVLAFLFLLPSR